MASHADTRNKRRLVLGAAFKYGPDKVRLFVKSLRATGYDGDIVMFIDAASFSLMRYLRSRNVKFIAVFHNRLSNLHFFSKSKKHEPAHSRRIHFCAAYVEKHFEQYDQIMTSDVRDVVFQSNPFDGLEGDGVQFYLECKDFTIGNEPHNTYMISTFLTPAQTQALLPERVTCCGVVIGGAAAMRDYLLRVSALLKGVPVETRGKIGATRPFMLSLPIWTERKIPSLSKTTFMSRLWASNPRARITMSKGASSMCLPAKRQLCSTNMIACQIWWKR